jgi:O-antigen ligase
MDATTTTASAQSRENVLEKLLQIAFLGLLVVRSFTESFSGLSVALGPFTVNPSVMTVLLMDGVGVLYLGLLWWRGERVGDRIGGAFGLWALSWAPWVYLAAAEFGVAGLTGLREWVRLLSLVLLYWVTREIACRRGPERVLHSCLLALPIPLAVTYYQMIQAPTARAFGVTVHPNNLGAFFVVMIALTVWKLLQPMPSLWKRAGWGLVLLIELVALLAPISSNAWLMFGVFVVVLAHLVKHRPLRIMAVIAGIASVAIFGLFWAYNAAVQREVQQNLRDLGVMNTPDTRGGTLEWRFQTWGDLLEIWRQRPFVGYGLNTTPFVNPQVGKAAHNDFLRYLVEGGIVGILFFLLLQGVVIWELWRRYRQLAGSPAQVLVAIALSLCIAWAIGSIGDNVIGYTVFQVYLWAVVAVASTSSKGRFNPLAPDLSPVPSPKGGGEPLPFREGVGGEGIEEHVVALLLDKAGYCRSCRALGIQVGDLLCPRCYSVTLGWGGLFFLVGWIFAGVFLISFYLWNQGAGAESFFVSWLVWYGLVAITFRHQHEGYLALLILTALTGWLAVTWFFPSLSWSSMKIPELALGGLIVVQLWGMIPRRNFSYLRSVLLPTGLLLGAAWSLKGLLEAVERFLYGELTAFGFIALGALGLAGALGGITWGITQRSWYTLWRGWALSASWIIALVQLGAIVSTIMLHSLARVLSSIDVLKRFAPLLPVRSVGLYTWGALGGLGVLLAVYWWYRWRLRNLTMRSQEIP